MLGNKLAIQEFDGIRGKEDVCKRLAVLDFELEDDKHAASLNRVIGVTPAWRMRAPTNGYHDLLNRLG